MTAGLASVRSTSQDVLTVVDGRSGKEGNRVSLSMPLHPSDVPRPDGPHRQTHRPVAHPVATVKDKLSRPLSSRFRLQREGTDPASRGPQAGANERGGAE